MSLRSGILPMVFVLVASVACAPGTGRAPSGAGTAPAPPQVSQPASKELPLPAQEETVVYGLVGGGTASDAGVLIAEDKGYFAQQKLKVEMPVFDSGARMVPSLGSGQLDIAGGSPSVGLYNAMLRDIDLRIVADKGNATPGFGFQMLVFRKDLWEDGSLRDYKDLKGRSVAMTAKGTSAELILFKALLKGGLTIRDVDIPEIEYPAINVALANKAIDAAITWEPQASAGFDRGVSVRFKGADEIYPYHQSAAIMYSAKFVKERPDTAKRWMLAYVKALRDYNDAFRKGKGKEEVIDILSRRTSVKDKEVLARLVPAGLNPDGYLNAQGISDDIDFFIANGYLEKKPDLSKVIDNQFVDYAIQVLGKYQ